MYRNENKINADIKAVIDSALQRSGITGWRAVQSFQREQYANMEKVVKFFTVSSNRTGWQGRDYTSESGTLYRIEKWRETRRVQIDCLMERKVTDTVDTITAVDITRLLVAFFSGYGGTIALEEKNFGRLQIENIRIPAALDDSERFRLYPGFDLLLVYDQDMEIITDPVSHVSVDTNGI